MERVEEQHRMNSSPRWTPTPRDIVDPNAQYGDENFLIVGVDSRYGAEQPTWVRATPTTPAAPARTP